MFMVAPRSTPINADVVVPAAAVMIVPAGILRVAPSFTTKAPVSL